MEREKTKFVYPPDPPLALVVSESLACVQPATTTATKTSLQKRIRTTSDFIAFAVFVEVAVVVT